ncbi:hypothetical protein Hanom_Chr16g01443351 [Helianthus anomalus]
MLRIILLQIFTLFRRRNNRRTGLVFSPESPDFIDMSDVAISLDKMCNLKLQVFYLMKMEQD